jgi:hypothetical protein
MTKELTVGRNIGAIVGMIVFLIYGIIPGFYFGSFGILALLSQLAGGPIEPSVIARMLIVIGALMGIFCIGTVSIVVGSVIGTGLGYLTSLFSRKEKVVKELA